MKYSLLLSLLLALPAAAQEPGVIYQLGQNAQGEAGVVYQLGASGAVSTATLIATFAGAGAFTSPITIAAGGPVTDTRSGTATYQPTAATSASATANQLRVDRFGALNDPPSTNYGLNSERVGSLAWVPNGAVWTQLAAVAPDSTTTAALCTPNTPGVGFGDAYQIGITTPSGTTFTSSAFLKAGTAPSAFVGVGGCPASVVSCTCTTSDGTACTPVIDSTACIAQATAATWVRVTATVVCNAATITPNISAGSGPYFNGSGTAYVWGAQLEPGGFATSYIPTVGTATARATETLTAPAVGAIGAATGSGVMTYTPEWSSSTAGADRVILSTAGLVIKWVNSSTAVSVTAGAGAGATATSAALTWAALSSHTIRWRYGGGAGSGVCVQVDAASEVCSGTLSALTPTDPLYIGGDASGGGGVSISGLKLCPGNSACN